MKFLLIGLLTTLPISARSQLALPEARVGGVQTFNQFVVNDWARMAPEEEKSYHGTPYLFTEWHNCDLETLEGQVFRDVRVKYHLYHGLLFYKAINSRDSSVVKDEMIKQFTIKTEDSSYTFHKFLVPLEKQTGRMEEFFILLDSGKYLLLAQPRKRLQESVSSALTAASTDGVHRFVDETAFLVRRPDRRVMEIRGPKRTRADIFGEDYKAIATYAKRNKLNWKKREDLERIVEFANQQE